MGQLDVVIDLASLWMWISVNGPDRPFFSGGATMALEARAVAFFNDNSDGAPPRLVDLISMSG